MVATESQTEEITAVSSAPSGSRSGNTAAAGTELDALRALRGSVLQGGGSYWAGLVNVYAAAAEAWIARAEGNRDLALNRMAEAARLDDGREKRILLENKLVAQASGDARQGRADHRRHLERRQPPHPSLHTNPMRQLLRRIRIWAR